MDSITLDILDRAITGGRVDQKSRVSPPIDPNAIIDAAIGDATKAGPGSQAPPRRQGFPTSTQTMMRKIPVPDEVRQAGRTLRVHGQTKKVGAAPQPTTPQHPLLAGIALKALQLAGILTPQAEKIRPAELPGVAVGAGQEFLKAAQMAPNYPGRPSPAFASAGKAEEKILGAAGFAGTQVGNIAQLAAGGVFAPWGESAGAAAAWLTRGGAYQAAKGVMGEVLANRFVRTLSQAPPAFVLSAYEEFHQNGFRPVQILKAGGVGAATIMAFQGALETAGVAGVAATKALRPVPLRVGKPQEAAVVEPTAPQVPPVAAPEAPIVRRTRVRPPTGAKVQAKAEGAATGPETATPSQGKQPWEMTKEEFEASAKRGRLRDDEAEHIRQVAEGTKPVAVIAYTERDPFGAVKILHDLQAAGRVQFRLFTHPKSTRTVAVVAREAADLDRLYQEYIDLQYPRGLAAPPTKPETPADAVREGRFYGYSADDINYYLQRNFGYDAVKAVAGKGKVPKPTGPEAGAVLGAANKIVTVEAKDAAVARIKGRVGKELKAGGPSTDELKDYATVGAYYVEAGIREFPRWSVEMVKALGEQIRPYLNAIWDKANTAYAHGKYIGNLNTERIETTQDAMRLLSRMGKEHEAELTAAKRGVRTWKETGEAAAVMPVGVKKTRRGTSRLTVGNLWLRPGVAANAEQAEAVRRTLLGASEKAAGAARAFSADRSNANLAGVVEAMAEAQTVFEAATGAAGEMGRGLNIYKKIVQARRELGQSPQDVFTARVLEMLGKEGRTLTEEQARLFAEIPADDIARQTQFLRDLHKMSTLDLVHSYWRANILSGVRTHLINTISNLQIGGVVEPLVTALRGAPREAAIQASVYWRALARGIAEGLEAFRTGLQPAELAKLELPRYQEMPGGIRNPWNWPGRALGAADRIAKRMSEESTLAANGFRQGRAAGLKGHTLDAYVKAAIEHPTPEALMKAKEEALRVTWQDAPDPGQQALMNLRRRVPGARYMLPFLQTPYKIARYARQYSPIGLADLHLPKEARADTATVVARATFGSLVLAAGALLRSQDRLTGAAPQQANKRDQWYKTHKAYSIKVGNRWVSYWTLGPFAYHMAAAAAMGDAWEDRKQATTPDLIARVALTVGHATLDASYLSGVGTLVDAIQSGADSGGMAAASQWFTSTVGGFIPFSALQRQVTQASDPTVRRVDHWYHRIYAGLPGLSQRLPPRLDTLGRPVKREPAGLQALTPFQVSKDTADKVDRELIRIGYAPGFVGKQVSIEGQKVSLGPNQRAIYQRYAGQAMHQRVLDLMNDPAYLSVKDLDEQRDLMQRELNWARAQIREEFKAALVATAAEKARQGASSAARRLLRTNLR